jgi:O-antigen/teichoic acid export membrane protein
MRMRLPRFSFLDGVTRGVSANIGWLFFDQALRLAVGLFVGVWTARYLGPSEFGLLNFATAFVAIVGSLATLGLNGVVVRNLVLSPSEAPRILASAASLQLVAGGCASVLAILLVRVTNADSANAIILVTIAGLALPFQWGSVVRYWYEAKVMSRYVVWVDLSIFFAFSAVRIALILTQASVTYFAWSMAAQAACNTLALLVMHFAVFGRGVFSIPDLATCRRLIRQGWPLALAGLAIIVYTRTDQLMLEMLCGSASVGVYAAALKLSEIWYALPVILTASLFPSILLLRSTAPDHFRSRMQQLLRVLVAAAFFMGVVMTVAAPTLVPMVFGDDYSQSASILRVHFWSAVFVFIGVASGHWLVAEGLQIHALYRTVLGALMNIAGNFVLIPPYGALGAAWATLLSQIVAAYLMDAVSVSTRPMFIMKTRALMFWRGWSPQRGLP